MSDRNQNTLEPGATFGRYVVTRILGSGGMGAVYEATHSDLKKRVALKVLHPEYAMHDEVQARFLREGETASRIRHPHVVDVTDFGVRDGIPFLVMEYLEGESLADMLEREHQLSVERIADLMLPVCAAVGAAHDAGVVHRDLKPDNIFLEKKRSGELVPKVVDFGISKVTDQPAANNLTSTGAMIGTPAYMSPEQMRTSKLTDSRTDQYAIGVIMYECATGEKPFSGETLFDIMSKIVNGDCEKPRTRRPDLPESFEALILRAMNPNPAQRFETIRSIGRALLPFASDRPRLLWGDEFGEHTGMHEVAALSVPARVSFGAIGTDPMARTEHGTVTGSSKVLDTHVPNSSKTRGNTVTIAVVAGLIVATVGVVVGWRATHTPATPVVQPTVAIAPTTPLPQAPAEYTASVIVHPSTAVISVDGRPAATGRFQQVYARDGSSHLLRIHADGFEEQSFSFRDAPPPSDVTLSALAEAVPMQTAQAVAGPQHQGNDHRSGNGRVHGHDAGAVGATQPATQPTPHATTEAPANALGANGAAILQ